MLYFLLYLTGNEIVKSKGYIIVEINNFKNSNGCVFIALYNKAKGFPDKADVRKSIKADIIAGKCKVVFKDMLYGIYAISGFHDENSNGKLDTGIFGILKEGTLCSNNAVGKFGLPKFDDAKFESKTSNLVLTIDIKYF